MEGKEMMDNIANSKVALEKERYAKQKALMEEAKMYNLELMNTKKRTDEVS